MNAYEEIDGKKYAKKLWYEYNFFFVLKSY